MTNEHNNTMLSKLRIKFVALNMVCVALVLVVVLGGILFVSHQQDQTEIDEALDSALNPYITAELAQSTNTSTQHVLDYIRAQESTTGGSPTSRIGRQHNFDPTPIAVYQVSSKGDCTYLSEASSACLSESVVEEALNGALGNPQLDTNTSPCLVKSQLDSLDLYYHAAYVNGTVYIAFADSSAIERWQGLALILAIGGVGALLLFFLISIVFSRWALKPVEASWQAQKNFVADASHELKTPLTVILANNSILQKHGSSSVASQSQWIESTEHEAKRMQGLVNDMLTLARLDEGVPGTQAHETVDLSTVVEGCLLQFESLAWEKNIQITDRVDENVITKGDHKQLARLVNTLLENACKYAGEGGQVAVKLSRTGTQACLSVTNSGTTIPEEDLPHVFDRFYRADKARTHSEAAGHGLGLSIAGKIVQAHEGSIGVASTDGQTTFLVKLPLD